MTDLDLDLEPGDEGYNYFDDLTPLDYSLVKDRAGRIDYVGGSEPCTADNWRDVQARLRSEGKALTGMFFEPEGLIDG